MQMDKEKELLRQQPHQQQPQLPGAAGPDPWPPPMAAGLVDESNSDWGIASHDFQVLVLGGRATGSFAFGKCEQKGGQSDREQESDWKREGIGTGWSFSTFGSWGHETPGRRLTRPRRTRLREKRWPNYRLSRSKGMYFFQLFSSTQEIVVVSKHACSSNDDTLQLV